MAETNYNPSKFSIWYANSSGQRLFPLDLALIDLEYVKRLNGIGWVKVRYGLGEFDLETLRVDSQIQVWRQPPSGVQVLETVCLLREWTLEYRNGVQTITLRGPDQNDLLRRRIVAYHAGTENAQSIDVATDDIMKAIVRTNLLDEVTDTARDWSGLGVQAVADNALGNTIRKGYAWRNVLEVLQELNDQSRADGLEVFFSLEAENLNTTISATPNVVFVFKTYIGQPGTDKTHTSDFPAVFSPEWGTLRGARLTFDHTTEINYVYAGGQGEGQARETAEVSDSHLIGSSVFGRVEAFKDARNEEHADGLEAAANAKLNANRPIASFQAELLDIERMRYGVDWFIGDLVTASVFGQQQDGVIRAIRIKVDGEGLETITAALESTAVVAQ